MRPNEGIVADINRKEVEYAVGKVKNRKAICIDIPVRTSLRRRNVLCDLINKLWYQENIQVEWKKNIVVGTNLQRKMRCID